MTTAQVVETTQSLSTTTVLFRTSYVHLDKQTQPTFEMTPGFKPFTVIHCNVIYYMYVIR